MVFASFSQADKQAFFELLDEYFESRPNLLTGAAVDGAKKAVVANGPALANLAASGARSQFGKVMNSGGPPKPPARVTPSDQAVDEDEAPKSIANRVAALGGAFNPGSPTVASKPPKPTPPQPPKRVSSGTQDNGLVTTKSIGRINTTSKMAAVMSLGKSAPPAPAAPIPASAFADKKREIVPPPVRRVPSKREPTPPPAEDEKDEDEGEWVEVLYDYEGSDPNDLGVSAGQQVWVTERTSEDWWTGQINGEGKSGLFPSSYVKIL